MSVFLGTIMSAPLSYVLHYLLASLSGVGVTFLVMRRLFPLRWPPVLWWTYFTIKAIVDANIWYVLAQGGTGANVEAFQRLWTSVIGFVSFIIVYQTFKGDPVLVCVCAVLCDIVAAVCTSFGTVVSNLLSGSASDVAYIHPFGWYSVVASCLILASGLCVRIPLAWLLQFVCRKALRHHLLWALFALAAATFFVSVTQNLSSHVTLSTHLELIEPFMAVLLGAVILLLLFDARMTRRREQAVRECAELASSYDRTVRNQLAALEQERDVLAGHELALGRLVMQSGDEDVAEQVHALERTYRKLSAGAYCDRPALDAVLSAGAHRLQSLGVRPSFSVAGVPSHTVVPAAICLTLLNLACEAAERTESVDDDGVELRIRGVGEQVLYRLEVPASWGALWARRFLSAFNESGADLVREQRQGEQRVVLVLSEGVPS